MQAINGKLIRAARVLLEWSQEDLAQQSGLGITTIRKAEAGYVPRGKTSESISNSIHKAGYAFIEPEGIQKVLPDIQRISGPNSVDLLLLDMLKTLVVEPSEIYAVTFSQTLFKAMSDPSNKEQFEHFRKLNVLTKIKCLFPYEVQPVEKIPFIYTKVLPQIQLGTTPSIIYDDKLVHIISDSGNVFEFGIVTGNGATATPRNRFETLWNNADAMMDLFSK